MYPDGGLQALTDTYIPEDSSEADTSAGLVTAALISYQTAVRFGCHRRNACIVRILPSVLLFRKSSGSRTAESRKQKVTSFLERNIGCFFGRCSLGGKSCIVASKHP